MSDDNEPLVTVFMPALSVAIQALKGDCVSVDSLEQQINDTIEGEGTILGSGV